MGVYNNNGRRDNIDDGDHVHTFHGSIGPRGQRGEKGEKGEKGDVGQRGPKSEKGETGNEGIQGLPGRDGDKGDRGPQGSIGVQGPKGDIGNMGPRGWTGSKGDKGEKGDKGSAGASSDVSREVVNARHKNVFEYLTSSTHSVSNFSDGGGVGLFDTDPNNSVVTQGPEIKSLNFKMVRNQSSVSAYELRAKFLVDLPNGQVPLGKYTMKMTYFYPKTNVKPRLVEAVLLQGADLEEVMEHDKIRNDENNFTTHIWSFEKKKQNAKANLTAYVVWDSMPTFGPNVFAHISFDGYAGEPRKLERNQPLTWISSSNTTFSNFRLDMKGRSISSLSTILKPSGAPTKTTLKKAVNYETSKRIAKEEATTEVEKNKVFDVNRSTGKSRINFDMNRRSITNASCPSVNFARGLTPQERSYVPNLGLVEDFVRRDFHTVDNESWGRFDSLNSFKKQGQVTSDIYFTNSQSAFHENGETSSLFTGRNSRVVKDHLNNDVKLSTFGYGKARSLVLFEFIHLPKDPGEQGEREEKISCDIVQESLGRRLDVQLAGTKDFGVSSGKLVVWLDVGDQIFFRARREDSPNSTKRFTFLVYARRINPP